MIPKINSLGRSFAGAAAYCLHDSPTPDDRSPETRSGSRGPTPATSRRFGRSGPRG
ncbi:hypothetical protein [Candidatus Palauibacter sp.]|uniref:hypothetical protein n=1 Tax=Candidatus Palauibacter sp. TaxID=3101350 RepID=UPI003B51F0CF